MENSISQTEERVDGVTPNGGDYEITYWKDENGNPSCKNKAIYVEFVEFTKDGKEICRTSGLANQPSSWNS